MEDIYGRGIEISAGFGPVGITEKTHTFRSIMSNLRPVFSSFHGKNKIENIVGSAIKN